ncbi:hypothetical protein [Streptomyces sp. NBC_00083]|uniref:hypothetical protein n=1 Tax=Streptomyces sp. NBC_00083 TaxID=2975647 RepID=UPI00224D2BE1|nr:hypothetical protein [Streptomyces sp. NBC_00083]MCX5387656.1 hypothetical protein [Streptomyces sp. NBC_00083]
MPGPRRDHIDFRHSTVHGPVQGQGIQYNNDNRTFVAPAEPDHARLGGDALLIRDYRSAVHHFSHAIRGDPQRASHHYYLSLANLGGHHPCALSEARVRLSLDALGHALTALPSCAYARVADLLIRDALASRYGEGRTALTPQERRLVHRAGKRHARELTTHVPAPENAWWRALHARVPGPYEG